MVGDYLWWSGWRDVEIVTIWDEKAENPKTGTQGGGGGNMLSWIMGEGGTDPLWVVRGRNIIEGGGEGAVKAERERMR